MEAFFNMIFLVVLFTSISINMVMLKKINILGKKFDFAQRNLLQTLEIQDGYFDRFEKKTDSVLNIFKSDTDRSLQSILERLDAAKPIKPNNWDSVKSAFKGPVRIDVNERT